MYLFEICLPYIEVVFTEYGDRDYNYVAEKTRELVLDKGRDQIEYFKKNHHEYKNMFRVADIDRDAVVRYTRDNTFVEVSRDEAKNGRMAEDQENYAFVREIMEHLRTPQGRATAERIFDNDLADRNVNQDMPRDAYKQQLIDKLQQQTQIYLVKNGLYLVPGLPDVLIHTRRNVTRRVSADQRQSV